MQRSDNTNFFVSLYKECLDGQLLLLLLFTNNLIAVPDTTDDRECVNSGMDYWNGGMENYKSLL